jgi:hypothetical protein
MRHSSPTFRNFPAASLTEALMRKLSATQKKRSRFGSRQRASWDVSSPSQKDVDSCSRRTAGYLRRSRGLRRRFPVALERQASSGPKLLSSKGSVTLRAEFGGDDAPRHANARSIAASSSAVKARLSSAARFSFNCATVDTPTSVDATRGSRRTQTSAI